MQHPFRPSAPTSLRGAVKKPRNLLPVCARVLASAAILMVAFSVSAAELQLSRQFNLPGNILMADQFNNRVIEVTPAGNIVWSFGLGPTNFTTNSIIGVNDAQRVGPLTLMCGTGTPAGVISQAPGGGVDNRVLLVDAFARPVWQYGQFGQTGSGPNLLSSPVQCTFLPTYHFLITDQGNNRIIEVTLDKDIVWQYPGANTNASDQLNGPNSAEVLENGNVLIADQGNNRAIEVTREDVITNTFTAGGTVSVLAFASDEQRPHHSFSTAHSGHSVAQWRHLDQRPIQQPGHSRQPRQTARGKLRPASGGWHGADRRQCWIRYPIGEERPVRALRRQGRRRLHWPHATDRVFRLRRG